MGQLITIKGLDKIRRDFEQCASELPHAINWALGHSADDIRDIARSNVLGSQYNLNSQSWKIRAKMSRKYEGVSEVGYFITPADADGRKVYWHIKFFERGAVRKTKGRIIGQHFLQNAGQSADALAVKKMNESIEFMLRKVGLS